MALRGTLWRSRTIHCAICHNWLAPKNVAEALCPAQVRSSRPNCPSYRFLPEIISHTVWLYRRFTLSLRDIEDLLAERNIILSYESIRQWCATSGLDYASGLREQGGADGDGWRLDEVTVSIQGERQYLWRGVDQDGDVLGILVQSRKDKRAEVSHEHQGEQESQMWGFDHQLRRSDF